MLDKLRGTGITIAIDDFGTGFSSLSQLQQLPIDEIKIDKSFVMRMETDANDFVLVRSIVELGRNLGLHVTAEGVESESVARSLARARLHVRAGLLPRAPRAGRGVPAR